MLDIINQTLRDTINESKPASPDYFQRTEIALPKLDDWFDRKEYMNICKEISSATASRDLKRLLEEEKIESKSKGRMTKYKKR